MRATRRALLALLALVGALVVAPSPTGAQATHQWTFTPANPTAEPDPAPTFFVRGTTEPIEACAAFQNTGSVSMNGITIGGIGTVAGGTLEVEFQPMVPGTYVVEATCTNGDHHAVVNGSVVVGPGTDPRRPAMTVSPLAVGLHGRVDVTATYCTAGQPGRSFTLIAEGPGGRSTTTVTADSTGTATTTFVPELEGTYTLKGTCSTAPEEWPLFVYPEVATVTVTAPPGSGDGPHPTTPDDLRPAPDALQRPPAARGVAASPRFTG